jgi:hypothetical protein
MGRPTGFIESRNNLTSSPPTYEFGEFVLDVARACVFRASEEIKCHA